MGPPPPGAPPTAPASVSEPEGPARAYLVVYSGGGVDVADLPQETEFVVGRGEDADLRLVDEKASRRHAAFRFDGRSLTVRDLGSRNGTRVNGRRISRATTLSTGDEVGIGWTRLVAGVTAVATHEGRRLLPWGEIEVHLAVAVRTSRTGVRAALALFTVPTPAERDALLVALPEGARAAEYGPGRIGVLLAATSVPAARDAAERVVRRSGSGVAAGLAVAPEDGSDAEQIVEAARVALATAGAGRVATARGDPTPDVLVVRDPVMRAALDLVHRVAPHDTTVLVLGETGTGKEVLARELHRKSRRSRGPFVAVNCGAIPTTLVEPTLFGHERGAFTGAAERREGMFHAANGGTLFLDEVGELSPSAQAAMLRVLERGEVTRVGGTREEPVDVRVVAASNLDLEDAVASGAFRRDLLFRLNSFVVKVPPLRERPEDLGALAEHVLAGRPMAASARKALASYPWPGNVRELLNVLERAMVLAGDGPVEDEHLPLRLAGPSRGRGSLRARVAGTEAEAIKAALLQSDGNRTHAARRLGISRRALLYKMKKLGVR